MIPETTCAQRDALGLAGEMGLRDPRFWSNIRGALTGESRAERVAVHARLDCAEGQSIRDAWLQGFWRAEPAPLPCLAILLIVIPIVSGLAGMRIARWYRGSRPKGSP